MKILRLPIIFIAIFAISNISLTAAQLATVKALKVTGSVAKYTSAGESPLKAGDILKEGDSIASSALSSALLVFSNGSTLEVKADTNLKIAKYTQTSFSGGRSYEQLSADPSQSQALIELNYGEVDGHVKSLRSGSKFNIQTALGTAAIRGTQFTVKLQYSHASNEFILTVTNLDGTVGVYSRQLGPEEAPVPIGDQLVISIGLADPSFDSVLEFLTEFIPANEQPSKSFTNPNVFTPYPEDPGVQIVSPETEE